MSTTVIWQRGNGPCPVNAECIERIWLNDALGLLSVEHDGSIDWDTLQALKNEFFGTEAVAIEVYPPVKRVVNNITMRHLWLLGPDDWWPDLGREGTVEPRTLREAYIQVAQS